MKKLSQCLDTDIFYAGTIITLPTLNKKFAIIKDFGGMSLFLIDLYRSGQIAFDIFPNVKNHLAIDKKAIKDWVEKYFDHFHQYSEMNIDEIVYIENMKDYFLIPKYNPIILSDENISTECN